MTLLLFVVPFGLHLVTTALCLLRLVRRPSTPATRPMVSILRPVCGLDRFDPETLRSSFTLDYPDYEVIFCAARADDPAVPLLRGLMTEHPDVPAQLLIGDPGLTGNPKLNNLFKGWDAAQAGLVVMSDANLLLPPDYLDRLLGELRPDTGLVSAPPVGIRPEGLAGAVEAAFLNGFQARWQLAADSLGFGFAQGKTLFWRRQVLEAAGGLPAMARNLAEDVAATKITRAAGLRVRLPARPFAQPIGQRSFAAVWSRQLRWSRVRRDGFPALFVLEALLGPWVPALALALLAGAGWLPLFFLGWYGAEWLLTRAFGWPSRPLDLLAALLRDLTLPALWLVTWARRGFQWRGTALAPGQRQAGG